MPPPVTRGSLARKTKKQIDNLTNKRNLDVSPDGGPTKKRSILGDLTNKEALEQKSKGVTKQPLATRKKSLKVEKIIPEEVEVESSSVESTPGQIQLDSNDESSYTTANEYSEKQQPRRSSRLSKSEESENELLSLSTSTEEQREEGEPEKKILPPGVIDHDYENRLDPYSSSNYVTEIFDYLKSREEKFHVVPYLNRQPRVSRSMRAIVVDWLVEVQEGFELNHESLYLAVKLVDMFLARTSIVPRDLLQLVAATAIFIACKFDERCPPVVDDFLYICDDAYNRKQLISMEIKILKTVGFDIGAPLSYSFLRRYARCEKLSMELLTLARFILEASLMEYEFIDQSDSLMAASSLCLALKMKNIDEWSATLQYYSGYKEEDLLNNVKKLNQTITSLKNSSLHVIRNKYSHKEFFEVAKVPPLPLED